MKLIEINGMAHVILTVSRFDGSPATFIASCCPNSA